MRRREHLWRCLQQSRPTAALDVRYFPRSSNLQDRDFSEGVRSGNSSESPRPFPVLFVLRNFPSPGQSLLTHLCLPANQGCGSIRLLQLVRVRRGRVRVLQSERRSEPFPSSDISAKPGLLFAQRERGWWKAERREAERVSRAGWGSRTHSMTRLGGTLASACEGSQ